jgi:hypothetical protein
MVGQNWDLLLSGSVSRGRNTGMSNQEKIQLKVIEVEAHKLTPGAKYIFVIPPHWHPDMVYRALDKLIGSENYSVLWMTPEI